ncbi:Hint domain-containing protein [Lutimaribacter pacificus]|uniref:Hint domain-containing protein n=1 Tax=Lutimaribacter pacificus TaxID=391948 RepID=UPI00165EEF08|nr:Hint domain-containing protein [Lutimaribacter pacificus]
MTERTIHIYSAQSVTITRAGGGATSQSNIIGNALNGDAFSWENPSDLEITVPGAGEAIALSFDDADGYLTDDPFSGSTVSDQLLTQPVTIDGVTYTPNEETVRWQTPPPVNVENEYEVTLFDDSGTAYRMVGVSITQGYTTTVVGITFEGAQPPPGTVLHYIQGVSSYGGSGMSTPITEAVPCFLAGTLIGTPFGPRPVETLAPGALVDTLDRGPMPLRWSGQSDACGLGPLAPVAIPQGALGNRRALLVSPNHRLFLRSILAELHFGHHEVLVPAKALIGLAGIARRPMPRARYVHLLLDSHEMLFSEGIASESLFTGAMAMGALDVQARAALHRACPGLDTRPMVLNRPALSRSETRLLLAAHDTRGSRPETARAAPFRIRGPRPIAA